MYQTKSSSEKGDALSIGFHRAITTRESKLTNSSTRKGNNHVRTYLKDVSRLAERQEIIAYGLVYELTLEIKSDSHASSHADGTDVETISLAGKVSIKDSNWYKLMLEQFVSRAATDVTYIKR